MKSPRAAYRKQVLLQRDVLLAAWERVFPHHDITTLRLAKPARQKRNKSFEALCDEAEALARRKPAPKPVRMRATPQTVVDAVVWSVRENGIAALDSDNNKRRLGLCDERAIAEINRRITALPAAAA